MEDIRSMMKSCLDVMRAVISFWPGTTEWTLLFLFRDWSSGMTALHSASRGSFKKLVNCVIELAKDCGICAKKLTGPDSDGNTPLHYSAMESDEDSVEAFFFGKLRYGQRCRCSKFVSVLYE